MNEVNCEFWLPVTGRADGFPYEVSDHGRVRNLKKKNILKPSENSKGYRRVKLYKSGTPKTFRVHHLVLWSFVGPPPGNIGNGLTDWQTDHNDGNRSNNHLSNLEWVTKRENHKRSPLNSCSRKQVRKAWRLYYEEGYTTHEIARKTGVEYQTIVRVINGSGYREYTEDMGEPDLRGKKGSRNSNAKLTAEIINEIRYRYENEKIIQKELAEEYDISQGHITKIVNYKVWTHV